MNDTPNGETNTPEPVKNDAPAIANTNTDELAQLRKEKEQAEMRARQLENEKRDREKQDELAKAKKLEEDNEFKILYEREKTQRETLENEREEKERQDNLSRIKSTILAGFSQEVVEVAEAAGMNLTDDSEEAQEKLKEKLTVIQEKVGTNTKKVMGNNVDIKDEPKDDDKKLYERMRFADNNLSRDARSKAVGKLPALDEMRKNAGLKV